MSQMLLGLATTSRRDFVLARVQMGGARYRPDFLAWLEVNFPIWERFEKEANAIYNTGRKHYGARTIWEVMRHETALKASNDGDWKLNDHRPRDLARLYLALYPERDGFFEVRERREAA